MVLYARLYSNKGFERNLCFASFKLDANDDCNVVGVQLEGGETVRLIQFRLKLSAYEAVSNTIGCERLFQAKPANKGKRTNPYDRKRIYTAVRTSEV
ncbi:hypothetical protein L596_012899 [Steinernema carpocapsae]|uniref:Uncharacterized protein n=1 Tax=Steinernema carpocapsae TaxID=34508 RepID=A0A4V6A4X7_STECR|nr:hypothetical protein L596_012899 [Steinernema carpocapsae]